MKYSDGARASSNLTQLQRGARMFQIWRSEDLIELCVEAFGENLKQTPKIARLEFSQPNDRRNVFAAGEIQEFVRHRQCP